MITLTCYFCEEQEETIEPDGGGMFFCDDCQRWQCNSEDCACVCAITAEQLFERFVDAATSPQEVIDDVNLVRNIAKIMQLDDFYRRSLASPVQISVRVYDEAQRRVDDQLIRHPGRRSAN
jgi:hypothetical protein